MFVGIDEIYCVTGGGYIVVNMLILKFVIKQRWQTFHVSSAKLFTCPKL